MVNSQREFAVQVVTRLRDAGFTALLAGGCVRDALLGRPIKDFDVATTARPEEVRTLFGHRKTLAIGASFGVIVVIGPPHIGHVEVATFRTEGNYVDGRHPESVAFCSPEEDARRRDFTINGMFFDPIEDRVYDYVGGQADLAARVVRAIGHPRDRVREDKLRMLRAVRFAATLNFALEMDTADAIRELAADLVVVSAERIAQEFKKMLVDVHRRQAIELAADVRLLSIVLPELDHLQRESAWSETLRQLELLHEPRFELSFAALLSSLDAKSKIFPICRRLKLSNDETDRIVWLVDHRTDLDEAPQLSLAALKRRLAHPYCADLLQLQRASRLATSSSLEPIEFCERFLAGTAPELIDPPPLVTGDDLVAMGLRPGPRFKQVLELIRDAQLNLEIANREQAIELAKIKWNK